MPSEGHDAIVEMLRAGSQLGADENGRLDVKTMRQGMEMMMGAIPVPEGVAFEPVDAAGVAAEWVDAEGVGDALVVHGVAEGEAEGGLAGVEGAGEGCALGDDGGGGKF